MELLNLLAKVKADEARALLESDAIIDVISTRANVPFTFPVEFCDDGELMWLPPGTRIILVLRGARELAVSYTTKISMHTVVFETAVSYPGAYLVDAYLNLPLRRKVEIIPLNTALFVEP